MSSKKLILSNINMRQINLFIFPIALTKRACFVSPIIPHRKRNIYCAIKNPHNLFRTDNQSQFTVRILFALLLVFAKVRTNPVQKLEKSQKSPGDILT